MNFFCTQMFSKQEMKLDIEFLSKQTGLQNDSKPEALCVCIQFKIIAITAAIREDQIKLTL